MSFSESVFGYLERHGLSVNLADAYRQEGDLLEGDFDEEHDAVPFSFARAVLDEIKEVLPVIDASVHAQNLQADRLLQLPGIASIEGEDAEKKNVISDILCSVSEAIADVIWEHQTGKTVREVFVEEDDLDATVASEVAAEAAKRLEEANAAWMEIYHKAMADFGIQSGG